MARSVWLSPVAVGGEEEARVRQSPQIDGERPGIGKSGRSVKKRGQTTLVDSRASCEPKTRKRIKTDTPKPAKKSRKLHTPPRSRVRSALRTVWLRSRERAARLKLAGNCCERCGVKASKAKGREVGVQVHHKKGIAQWEQIIDLIFEELLVNPELLEAVCVQCHNTEHHGME